MSHGNLSKRKLPNMKERNEDSNSESRFLLSPKCSMDDNFQTPIAGYKMNKEFRKYKSHFPKGNEAEEISHYKMNWNNEELNELLTQEVQSTTDDSSSSISDGYSIRSSSSLENYEGKAFDLVDEKRNRIMQSKWGGYGLHLRLWDDENSPIVSVRKRSEIVLDQTEFCGILSDRMIGASSSFLALSPENGRHVLSKCILDRMKLKDISVLRYHRYLQYLDLSHNFLKDLQPLCCIPYLVFLNASHNNLRDVLNFTPPWYLTYVNLSHNDITLMTDLSEFWSIVRLDLSHNAIETISGLQNLRYLKYLNLSYNLIETVSNLDGLLSIQELILEYNYITSFKSANPESGISTLVNLRTVIMGHNRLTTLQFFQSCMYYGFGQEAMKKKRRSWENIGKPLFYLGAYGLRLIDLRYNKIADLLEISHLKSHVYEVDLRGNPCTKWPSYKDVLLFSMPSVKFVDGAEVSISEKVSAATLFDPPVDLLAARSISKLVLLEQLNVQKIDVSVTPYDVSSPPLIILSGPSAVKKVALGIRVAEKLTNRVVYCRSHTTRELPEDEDESKAYYFVKRDEFNDMARRGEFLSIQELLGNSYGFHRNEIAAMRMENKIGITQMDLNATIQMMNRYSNVKSILVITRSEKIHREWIKEKFHVFTWIKHSVENLLAVKVGQNILTESPETSDSKIGFISDLVNDVVNKLELPAYSIYVRPQGTGATATDIIEQSKTYLPKVVKTRSQVEVEEKRHITFKQEGTCSSKVLPGIVEEYDPHFTDLKVIMDEHSTIIVDDEESKRKRKKARFLYRKSVLKLRSEGLADVDEEFGDSTSSEQSLLDFSNRRSAEPEYLKNMYIEIVLKSRKMYIEQHRKKPGFYSLVIFTDDFGTATIRLIDFLHETYVRKTMGRSNSIPEIEYLNRFVIPEKIQAIVKEMRENLSTAQIQKKTLLRIRGTTSWKDSLPSQTSPSSKDLMSSIEEEFKKRSKVQSSN